MEDRSVSKLRESEICAVLTNGRWLIPWLCLLYLLSFLDRTNIGNARLAGLEEDLNMSGRDYNDVLTIFFVSYALAEPVTNVLLKRYTPRVFFTVIMLLWGIW